MTNISTLEKSDQQEESLVEQAAHSKDMTVRDLANGFLSGVDREEPNIKYPSQQAYEEVELRKKHPGCDANLLYLQQKYNRERSA